MPSMRPMRRLKRGFCPAAALPSSAHPSRQKAARELDGDERTGAPIIAQALSSPLRQIAENAGQEGSIVLQDVENLPETAATTPSPASIPT